MIDLFVNGYLMYKGKLSEVEEKIEYYRSKNEIRYEDRRLYEGVIKLDIERTLVFCSECKCLLNETDEETYFEGLFHGMFFCFNCKKKEVENESLRS